MGPVAHNGYRLNVLHWNCRIWGKSSSIPLSAKGAWWLWPRLQEDCKPIALPKYRGLSFSNQNISSVLSWAIKAPAGAGLFPLPCVSHHVESDIRRVQGRAESPCCARRRTPVSPYAAYPAIWKATPEGCRGERKAPAAPAGARLSPLYCIPRHMEGDTRKGAGASGNPCRARRRMPVSLALHILPYGRRHPKGAGASGKPLLHPQAQACLPLRCISRHMEGDTRKVQGRAESPCSPLPAHAKAPEGHRGDAMPCFNGMYLLETKKLSTDKKGD